MLARGVSCLNRTVGSTSKTLAGATWFPSSVVSNSIACGILNRYFSSNHSPPHASEKVASIVDSRIVDFPVHKVASIEVAKTFSLDTANQQQISSYKINKTLQAFQKHKSDTGSASVQIGVMTQKILNFARHYSMHKKDKQSHRGFQMLVSRRRRMMQYLKRYDAQEFGRVVKELGLQKEASQLR